MTPDHCIVYILINEAMPDYIKIGTTNVSLQQRMAQLYTTAVPVPFECYYAGEVDRAKNVEKRLHRAFDKFRVNKNREFFEIEPEAAADIIRMVALRDVTPKETVVENAEDSEAIQKLEKRAERFSFKMVGIGPGTVLRFKLDDSVTCTVLDNQNVEFEGAKTSLSAAALSVQHSRGTYWKAVKGTAFWMHDGQTLKDLRDTLENEDA
ncbi:MAG: GIY-YIG nuclease family protein [Pseudoruegeria sp.]